MWLNGLRHGRGTLTFPTGDKIMGDFIAGILNGKAVATMKSGVSFEGI